MRRAHAMRLAFLRPPALNIVASCAYATTSRNLDLSTLYVLYGESLSYYVILMHHTYKNFIAIHVRVL